MSTQESEYLGLEHDNDNSNNNADGVFGSVVIEDPASTQASEATSFASNTDTDTNKGEESEDEINESPFAHMSPEAPGATEGELFWLFIRTIAVVTAFWAGSYLVSTPATPSGRTLMGLFFITIFYLIPRAFYHRYQTVYLNEELRTNFKPKGILRRFIYATRCLLSGRIMLVLSALMALFILATCARDGIIILTCSAVVFTLCNLFLGTGTGIKLFHAEAIPAVYPFYRRWISIMTAAFTAAACALFIKGPDISAEEALRQVGSSLASSGSEWTALLYDTLNLTAALKNYVCALALGTPWELPTIILLVMLPYAILGLNTGLGLSMLSLSRAEYIFLIGKHHWVKTDRTLWRRYWKSIALPIFLVGFFSAAWTVGAPYYQTYLSKSKLMAGKIAQQVSYEKIGAYYCKAGTVKNISAARTAAVNRIKEQLAKANNEVNAAFSENAAKLPVFVNWYIGRHQKYPFTPHNEQLRAALKTGLNLDALYIKTQNIRRDLGTNVAAVYAALGQEVTDILKNNAVEAAVAEKAPENLLEFTENDILSIKTAYGTTQGLFSQFRLVEPLPNFERDILASIDDPKAPWFLPVGSINKAKSSVNDGMSADALLTENDLIGDDDSKETETAVQIIDKGSLLAYITSLLDQASAQVNESLAKGVGIKPEGDDSASQNNQNSASASDKAVVPEAGTSDVLGNSDEHDAQSQEAIDAENELLDD